MADMTVTDSEAPGHDHHQGQGPVDRGQEQLAVHDDRLAPVGVVDGLVVVEGIGAGDLDVPAGHPGQGDRPVPEPRLLVHLDDPR